MSDREFIPPTHRSKMTKARAAKIFLQRNGECWNCHLQIRDGEKWTVEHPDALALGGSDNDADLWPIHTTKCVKEKNASDAAAIAKRNRIIAAGYVGNRKPKSKWKRKMNGTVVLRGQE